MPWNYPIMLACGKIGSALVAGNAFILKPSPFAPYCNLKMAELGTHFFPPGIFQALSGEDNLGPGLLSIHKSTWSAFSGSGAGREEGNEKLQQHAQTSYSGTRGQRSGHRRARTSTPLLLLRSSASLLSPTRDRFVLNQSVFTFTNLYMLTSEPL